MLVEDILFSDRIYGIDWILLFCQFPDETDNGQSAFGGGKLTADR